MKLSPMNKLRQLKPSRTNVMPIWPKPFQLWMLRWLPSTL